MKIYTMGFKGKSQEEFIKTINKKKIELVVDMREKETDFRCWDFATKEN